MTIIQTFSEVRSLDPGDLTLSDLDLKFLQHVRKRCVKSYTKNGGDPHRHFLDIGEKPEGGGVFNPRPGAS